MGETTKYVVGFMFLADEVLLVRKLHPSWQAGLLNGVGGHVDPGESFDAAMVREFEEETGRHVASWQHFATLGGDGWTMYCYRVPGEIASLHGRQNDVGEGFQVCKRASLVAGFHETIPNLRWLIPMADIHDAHNWPYRILDRSATEEDR